MRRDLDDDEWRIPRMENGTGALARSEVTIEGDTDYGVRFLDAMNIV